MADIDEDLSDGGEFSDTSYNSDDEDLRLAENSDLAHRDITMDDAELLAVEHDDILKMTFESEEEAYNFFNDYAKGMGFNIRRGKRKSETGSLFFRQFLCSREGFRQQKYSDRHEQKRQARGPTRCGCLVEFCVKLDWSTGEWCVAKFVDTHNHLLAKPDKACLLRSHKKIKNSMKLRILSSQFAGLNTHQILDALQSKNNDYENVGLAATDLYDSTHRKKIKKIHLGDGKTVLSRMRERKESDPDFFYKYQVDDIVGNLTHLFWSDSQSRLDYGCLGDVLVFDSTCRVNRYNMPIIPFVGLSNHRNAITFGCGIVTDDSAESYNWLLATFMEAMNHKRPASIITDGDPALGEAIKVVFGDITHRWSTWDVDRMIASNLKPPSSSALKSLVNTEYTPKEFEGKWKEFISSDDALKDNKWLSNMYECRRFWAAAFLRKKTFLGIESNQKSKSLNSRLHRHLDRHMSLLDFVEHYDHVLARTRRDEAELDRKALHSVPVTTTTGFGLSLEKHAASIYTPKILNIVQSEMLKAKEHEVVKIVVGKGSRIYTLAVEGQDDDFMSVECVGSPKIEKFVCSCQKLECEKVPCSHILAVLIDMKVNCIPQCCVRERWTKNAKRALPPNKREGSEKLEEMNMYRDLSSLSAKVIQLASKSRDWYLEMKEQFSKMLKKFEIVEDVDVQDKNADKEDNAPALKDKEEDKSREACSPNKDPALVPVTSKVTPVNSKDALKDKIRSYVNAKRKNKCGYCNQRGHSVRTCQLMKEASRKGIEKGEALAAEKGEAGQAEKCEAGEAEKGEAEEAEKEQAS